MSARFTPFPQLAGAQSRASDPTVHAALSASAGTGKTQVLTARVLRLLLQGARPESILCLTFTKAAAAEMANRIGRRLAHWVRLPENALRKELFALGEPNDPPALDHARRLFARVLDCPGGLKIQTIHAFSQALLAAFPAEAGIVPGFQPIEGRGEQELVRRTLAELMVDAERRGDQRLLGDVQRLSRRLSEAGAIDYLRACARRSDALARLGAADDIEQRVLAALNVPPGDPEQLAADACGDDRFDCRLLQELLAANRQWNTASGRTICANIEDWLAASPARRASGLGKLADKLVTKDFRPYKISPNQVAACGHYGELVEALATLLSEIDFLRKRAALAREIVAGLRAGQAFAKAYVEAKRAAGVADFNDLIEWTRALLNERGMGDWVRYKLDRQIDHVLVDEAQDTNAAQWEIIERIVEEFFSGSSESENRHRTLFMVGDFKQSIYGFQGTDPERFHEARDEFRKRAEALAGAPHAPEFRDLSIAASFRSAQPVLDVVDAMIGVVGHEALALPELPPPHRAHHAGRAGEVELWLPFAAETPDDDSDEGEERWISVRDRQYAEALADRIRAMIDDAPVLGSTKRPLAPSDILVLVRSRGELAALIVARLFAAGVPVAGIDRLHLHEPLAVQDLLAAMKFAVQPNDDLSLACVLVSPLVGWDQDRLRDLAYGRSGSLWRRLRERAGEGAEFAQAHAAMADLLRIADFTSPAQFLETILSGPMDARRKLYGRLGMAARDAIDELMNSAIEFERTDVGSLDRFLAWFSRGTAEVQRDPGQPGNEVRVMTVHGAKGLEAPVVILADATGDPDRLGRTPLTVDLEIDGVRDIPLLRPRKEERGAPFEETMQAQDARDLQEHWRLLYVALTRAADRLIVSGVRPKERKDGADPRPANSWHRIVEQALLALGAAPGDGHVALRSGTEPRSGTRAAAKAPVPAMDIPAWARTAAPPEARPPRPLAPSALTADDESSPPPSAEMRAAARRGTLIHQLLERLPAVAAERRRSAAERWLDAGVGISDAAERAELAEQACRLLADERFAPLFGPGSLAEAPLAATLPDGRVIAGTVDRLCIAPDRIMVIDYKTGRVPPHADAVPRIHRAQMDAYVEALGVIFPGREVRAALLYTAGPMLIELVP